MPERRRFLADRSLTAKSAISAGCVGLVAILVAALSIDRMSNLRDDLRIMKSDHVDSLQQVADLHSALGRMYRGELIYLTAAGDATVRQNGRAEVTAADTRTDEAVAVYRRIAAKSPVRIKNLDEYVTANAYYRNLRDVVLFGEAAPAGFTPPATDQVQSRFTAEETAMNEAVANLQASENAEGAAIATAAGHEYTSARLVTLLALVIGFALAADQPGDG